ncbi:hypothetical protein BGX28_003076 [Mortierella sp. GBA30]|nr:hypothetical protein BGX28_003076 [Mortierella sp. GBA30]
MKIRTTKWAGVKYYCPDPKPGVMVPFFVKLGQTFRADTKPAAQFDSLLSRRGPWDGSNNPMHVRQIQHRDHPKGGSLMHVDDKAHKNHQGWQAERNHSRTQSYNGLMLLGADLIEGRLKHPMVTDDFRKQFTSDLNDSDKPSDYSSDDLKAEKKRWRYRRAANFAQRFQTEYKPGTSLGSKILEKPSKKQQEQGRDRPLGQVYNEVHRGDKSKIAGPGGIEVMALKWTHKMPRCSRVRVENDRKWLSIDFDKSKYYLPIENITATELQCLLLSTFEPKAERLCIDILAAGDYYNRSFDGGVHTCSTLSDTMEKADFLLAELVFGRNAFTGILFEPKLGQLEGYKNPVLETTRLLNTDKEYAATRCRYYDVFLHPTLVCNDSFTVPATSPMGWWPQLGFKKTVFKVVYRLSMVDLSHRPAYYDIPESENPSDINPEADILLRPYKPLMEAFRKHGAEWIASEPVLHKLETVAKSVSSLIHGAFLRYRHGRLQIFSRHRNSDTTQSGG